MSDLTPEALAEMKRLANFPLRRLRQNGGDEMLLDLIYCNAPALLRSVEENQQVRSVLFSEVATPETTLPQQAAAYVALVGRCKQRIAELERNVNDCRQIITTYSDETQSQQERIAELEQRVSALIADLKDAARKLEIETDVRIDREKRIAELESQRVPEYDVELSLAGERIAKLEEALREIKATSVRMTMPEWGRIDRLVDEAMKGGGK